MSKLVTKKNVFIASLIGGVIMLLFIFLSETHICYEMWNWCRINLWELMKKITPFLLPSLPIFLCSLITYRLRDDIFNTWLKGTAVMLPIMMFFILRSSEGAYGGALASAMTVTRAEAALQLSVIYFVFSLILIAYKSFSLRKKN